MNYLEAYAIIGALLLVATSATSKTWPSPIVFVICLVMWPIPVVLGVMQAVKDIGKQP